MSSPRILVIGGSAAGPKTAARAKRLAPDAQVTLIQKEAELSMATCGYPYYVAGVFDDRDLLVATPTGEVRDAAFFAAAKGVTALTLTEALSIDRAAKTVRCRNLETGEEFDLAYDKLVICTGSSPRRPPIPGLDLAGVTALHSLADADFLKAEAASGKGRSALVAGGGLVGLETCEALVAKGFTVTVVEAAPRVLTFLDAELGLLIERHLRAKGVRLITGKALESFAGVEGKVASATLAGGEIIDCDLAVVALGVVPNVKLAKEAGLTLGVTGGIEADAFMRTSDHDIYAAGDCAEIVNRVSGAKTLAPYGDLANLEGRVAGENAALGDCKQFPGTIHSRICKVFAFTAGSAGLSEREALAAGFSPVSAVNAGPDKPAFMDGKLLVSKITADRNTGRVLGVQAVGIGNVGRLLAEASMAVGAGLTLTDLATADLPYAPPYSPAIGHLIVAAHILQNKLDGRLEGISSVQAKALLDGDNPPFFLDVREEVERNDFILGIGETLIPIGRVKDSAHLLPADKKSTIVCYCKVSMRGYEARLVLLTMGYTNVTVMEGGIMAWPFARAK